MCKVLDIVDELRCYMLTNASLAFYAQVLLQCRVHVVEDHPAIASVNATDLYINPQMFLQEDTKHQLFVLLHEAFHPAYLDHIIGRDLDHSTFNQAADYWINLRVAELLEYKPREGFGLLDDKYRDWTKYEIYEELISKQDKAPEVVLGDDLQKSDGDDSVDIELITKVQQAVIITEQTYGAGSVSGDVTGMLDSVLSPKLPWDVILKNVISEEFTRDDYSYRRPNMQYLDTGIILPTLYSESIGRIGVATDSSVSVSDKERATQLGCIREIWEEYSPEGMDYVSFNTELDTVLSFDKGDDISTINSRSHGGTSIVPVLEFFNENTPEVLIVFTDMEFSIPSKIPDYPVIWVAIDSRIKEVPYGTLIHINS